VKSTPHDGSRQRNVSITAMAFLASERALAASAERRAFARRRRRRGGRDASAPSSTSRRISGHVRKAWTCADALICPVFRKWQKPDDALPSWKIQNKISEGTMPAKFDRRHFIATGMAAAAMPLLLRRAFAQGAWPSRQIRMICSYPAGGQTDLLARAFGEFISRQVGQPVVIENKADASGSIGAAEVARAEPDGQTILCSISTTYVMNRVMMKNPGYDMDKDLTLVSVIPGAGLPLVASPKSGIKTLDEFVAFARKSGKVNFGTYSAGIPAYHDQ
jgi:Tripartite tricarboxylate transporter family receptor